MPYPLVPRVEMLIDGTWTDVSTRLAERPVKIKRGRPSETSNATPSTLNLELNNDDGALTPRHPLSPYYPHIRRGATPIRVSLGDTATALQLDGDTANNASATAPPITGDLRIEFEGNIDWGAAPGALEASTLVGQWKATGDQRVHVFWKLSDGRLAFTWSPDGTLTNALQVFSTASVPWSGLGFHAVAVTIDVDDGAGGHTVTFEHADTLDGTWTELETVTGSGTTSLYNAATSPLEVGPVTGDGTATPFVGRGTRMRLYNSGSLDTNPDFTAQTAGAPSFIDSESVTWTMNGTATLVAEPTNIRFQGTIGEITPVWPEGDIGLARVRITAAGTLRRLTQGAKPLDSSLKRRIMDDRNRPNLYAYWPMEDGRDSTILASALPTSLPARVTDAVRPAANDDVPASLPLPSIAAGQFANWNAKVLAGGVPFTVEEIVWIPTPETDPASTTILVVNTEGTATQWRITVNDTTFRLRVLDVDGNEIVNNATVIDPRFFDQPTMIRLDVSYAAGIVTWTWVVIPLDRSGSVASNTNTFVGTVTQVTRVGNTCFGPPDGITWGHVVVHNGIALGWLALAETAFEGERAARRFARLCAEEGIPHSVVGDPADSIPMGPQGAKTLVDLLEECAAADGGIMGDRHGGEGLQYRTHDSLYNQAPALVLDTTKAGLTTFEPTEDDQALRNDVTVKRDGGSSAQIVDPAVDDPDDPTERYDVSYTRNVETDAHLPNLASWGVHIGTWPEMRYPKVETDLTVAETFDPTIIDGFSALIPGDVTQLANLPAQHPTSSVEQITEGWVETITSDRWRADLDCSPAGPWQVGVRDDTDRGRRDTSGSVLDADFDAGTDTTMDVETTVGPFWTTAAGDLPFDLNVGDAQVTVTAIAAPVGQVQTFTVSTTIGNDITKTVPAGTPVHLWRPTVRAL